MDEEDGKFESPRGAHNHFEAQTNLKYPDACWRIPGSFLRHDGLEILNVKPLRSN